MTIWSILTLLAFVAPMAAMLARVLPECFAACRRSRPLAMILAVVFVVSSAFLIMRPHDDSFAGLDCAATRDLALALDAGRPPVGPDTVLASVPPDLQGAFRYRTAIGARPTRDLAFQLDEGSADRTVPFFTPFLPLAAAGSGVPIYFPGILASIWLATLLAACAGKGGKTGVIAAVAFLAATPWPAWFLRGFYAEGAGTLLATSVLISSLARPMRGAASFATAGFALGFAACAHPTMVVVSAPVALALFATVRTPRNAAAIAAGGVAGLAPTWFATRYVCSPYGDWTRLEMLARMFASAPEHRILMAGSALACVLGIAALAFALRPRGRAACARVDAFLGPTGWLIIALLPVAGIAALGALRSVASGWLFEDIQWYFGPLIDGARAIWHGIRIPCAILWIAAACVLTRVTANRQARIALVGLSFASLLFLYVKGLEVPIGIWSQRRFLPVALSLAALFAPVVAEAFARLDRGANALACVGLLALAAINPMRWPDAWIGIDEAGARAYCANMRRQFDFLGRPLTVFDYFNHSVPFAASLEYPVLGLSEHARKRWPEVARWIADVAKTGDVCVVTSYEPTTLEEGFELRPVYIAGGTFKTVVGRRDGYLPTTPGSRKVDNVLMQIVPAAPKGEPSMVQEKTLDGGPIGLRGPWGATKNGGTWTRQGSGVIGPVSEKLNGHAYVTLDAAWFPPKPADGEQAWTNQVLKIVPPCGGEGVSVNVPEGRHTIKCEIPLPASAQPLQDRAYRFYTEHPYNPAEFGQRGYDADLGVFLYSVKIEANFFNLVGDRRMIHSPFPGLRPKE